MSMTRRNFLAYAGNDGGHFSSAVIVGRDMLDL
jgi:hypothetical protein